MRIQKVTAEALKTSRVSKHVKHNGAAASGIVHLDIDEPFRRNAHRGKPPHEGTILIDENLPDVPFGQINHAFEENAGMLSVSFFELIDPTIDASEGHSLRSVVAKSPNGPNAVNEL
ncbi:MAG: hypothetical protein ABSF14_10115 [Terriglobia bacterium]